MTIAVNPEESKEFVVKVWQFEDIFIKKHRSPYNLPLEGSRWKDWLLVSLLLVAVVGGWAALRAGRASRHQVQRMLRDMEQLRKAEMALDDMQKELEKARLEQVCIEKTY